MRAGSILPLGPTPSWTEGPLTLRLFPLRGAKAELELFDDDGDSVAGPSNPSSHLHIEAQWGGAAEPPRVKLTRSGPPMMRWPEILFEDASGAPISVISGQTGGNAPVDQVRVS
jgi:alpha-glucosidase